MEQVGGRLSALRLRGGCLSKGKEKRPRNEGADHSGGDVGIRTLDALLGHTHLAGEHLRPLGHISVAVVNHTRLPISVSTKISRGQSARFALFPLAAAFLLVVCLVSLCPLSAPRAWAAADACVSVDVSAQAETDASLHVVEQRTLSFGGLPQVLLWDFEDALADAPEDADLSIVGVRVAALDAEGMSAEGWRPLSELSFVLDWRDGAPSGKAAYSFDSPKNTTYVFLDAVALEGLGLAGESLVVELEYVVEKGVSAYEDVAEVSWPFIPDTWGLDSRDVAVSLALPVPAEASAQPGLNVFAWGHGPAEGSLSLRADGSVVYADDLVRAGRYLEARVLFPVDWLSNAEPSVLRAHQGELLLESAQAEEEAWSDADSGRLQGRLSALELAAFACAGVLAAGLVLYLAFCRERKPDFTGDFWFPGLAEVEAEIEDEAEVEAENGAEGPSPGSSPGLSPENVPSAVLGRLMRWNRESLDDFAAAVLSLEQAGALSVSRGSYPGPEGEPVDDFYLTVCGDSARACDDPLDRATLNLLFSRVAAGAPSLWMGTVRAWAKENPHRWLRLQAEWQRVLSGELARLDLFDHRSKRVQLVLGAASAVVLAAGLLSVFLSAPPAVLLFVLPTSFSLLILANYAPRRTKRGNDLAARCKALCSWLRVRGDSGGSENGESERDGGSGSGNENGSKNGSEALLLAGWVMGEPCDWPRAHAADVISASLAEATESARAARL